MFSVPYCTTRLQRNFSPQAVTSSTASALYHKNSLHFYDLSNQDTQNLLTGNKDIICKNWPSVEFMNKKNREQLTNRSNG